MKIRLNTKDLILLLLLTAMPMSLMAQESDCPTCTGTPLNGNAGEQLDSGLQVSVTFQEQSDKDFIMDLQEIMLKNLKDDKKDFKYLDKSSPDYKGDEFLLYSTEIFAAEAASNAQADYGKEHKGETIPADKFEDYVLKAAKDIIHATVKDKPNQCYTYICKEPGCADRKRDVDSVLAKIN